MDTDRHDWLLLHGTPLTPEVWDPLLPLLPGTGAVLRPDITPAGEAGDVLASLVDRVHALLPPGTDSFHVVGHSFGGQVAIDLALTHPNRVRSLTIMCSRDTPYSPFSAAAAALRQGKPGDLDAAMERWFRPHELLAAGPVVRYARHCLTKADPASWARALDGIATFDRAAEVARIQVPVTLIAAEFDRVSSPAIMTALSERLPRGQLHVMEGAAHMSPFLDPPTLSALLVKAAQRANSTDR